MLRAMVLAALMLAPAVSAGLLVPDPPQEFEVKMNNNWAFLTWETPADADGVEILRQVGEGPVEYLMTTTDTTARDSVRDITESVTYYARSFTENMAGRMYSSTSSDSGYPHCNWIGVNGVMIPPAEVHPHCLRDPPIPLLPEA